ncbi:mitochondrial inner membrane protease subunit 2 isoform X2 [Chrysoperla carnea]|uniref:mitochondrial inner membrane protease subunit 2 isoform X2 n=1 Tax=Chrysoperla carnea TaxID=189513 RepID=UPI001D0800E5|nr:mitochondrial inner membrane protease subunit 2 isoform X2 [Chrysoperla carnea]
MRIYTFYRNILIGIPIGITVLDSVGYVARVDGSSMQPALNPDNTVTDYIFLNRWAVRSYEIERGDIVSLISPKNPDQKIIKRVIGLQGDIINTIGYKKPYICVPEGYCWIEGDHTGNSLDSNTFGPVSLGLITAKASVVVWPPSRWQKLETKLPPDRTPINLGLPQAICLLLIGCGCSYSQLRENLNG